MKNRLIKVIDSHTGGEPTRVIIEGAPLLKGATLKERTRDFQKNHDTFRSAVVNEPRGFDAMVGALLTKPKDSSCVAGVIFFNNVSTLGMCVHGTIGLIATLAYLKRIDVGIHKIETPVGIVSATLHLSGEVTVKNVRSYRHQSDVTIAVENYGVSKGEIAWGGNWFFLIQNPPTKISFDNIDQLIDYAWRVRQALQTQGIFGKNGAEIDHIELFSDATELVDSDSKNFVLCPGKAYDRSPCGTGTSAKLACLYESGKLRAGEIWRQESIIGSVFEGSFQIIENMLYPSIKGSAFMTGEATLILNDLDPFKMGIRK